MTLAAIVAAGAFAADVWNMYRGHPCNDPPAGSTARCNDGSWSAAPRDEAVAGPCWKNDGVACYVCPGPWCER